MQHSNPSQDFMQAFRSVRQNESPTPGSFANTENIVHIDCHLDPVTQQPFVLWDDIQHVFDDALHIRDKSRVVPFLKGSDFEILEPRRIAAAPDVVLDVIVGAQMDSYASIPSLIDVERPPRYSSSSLHGITKQQDVVGHDTITVTISLYTEQEFTRTIARARRGDEKAQIVIGDIYRDGKGCRQDLQKAMDWYLKAAEQGNAIAQCRIGDLYHLGLGIYRDYITAMVWYREAADQGNAEAQNNVALLYKNGQGVAADYTQAEVWFRKAAEQGHMEAQSNLGYFYGNGQGGLEQDYAQAMRWYIKAAEQGQEDAQCSLGVMYHDGTGVAPDYARALEWYLRAANQGVDEAEFGIGVLFYNGQGVAQDYEKAVERFSKVAEKGHLRAKECLKVEEERQQVLEQERQRVLEEKRKREAFDPIRANVWLY